MSEKPRLFMWGDGMVPTGFGIVNEHLSKDLGEHFDVHFLAINYHGLQDWTEHKQFKMVYNISQDDPLGFQRMQMLLQKLQPSHIFLHQDIFHIARIMPMIQQLAPQAKVVIYFPVDGSPFSPAWKQPLIWADHVFTYSEFGVKAIERALPELKGKNLIDVLYVGADENTFKPLSRPVLRKIAREQNLKDKFFIVNVNRFQPRKMLGLTSRAVLMLAGGYHICKCGNWYPKHLDWCDLNMCPTSDIVETVEGVGKENICYYIHAQPQEMAMGQDQQNTLPAHIINAGFTKQDFDSGFMAFNQRPIYTGEITSDFINQLYNLADVNLSGSIGEGAGMSLIEAQFVGTTCIAPKNSAIPEVIGTDVGNHLIDNAGLIEIALDNGHKRPIFDVRGMVKALTVEYNKWLENDKKKVINDAAMQRAREKFQWQDKRDALLAALLD